VATWIVSQKLSVSDVLCGNLIVLVVLCGLTMLVTKEYRLKSTETAWHHEQTQHVILLESQIAQSTTLLQSTEC